MKKIYTLIAAAICVGSINAQILTQANHAPIVSDSYQTVNCTTVGVNPGGNGAGQTWNFSSLTVQTTTTTNNGVTVASTGSASTYPSASVAISVGTGTNSFYSSNASSLNYWGGNVIIGGQNVTMSYTSAACFAAYPMSLGTTTNNNIAGSLNSIAGPGNFSGTSTVTASGTGTIMLPGGYNFSNILKVTTSQAITFTLSFGSGTYTQNKYDYYSALSKFPLFSISNATLFTSLAGTTTETVTLINNNYNTVGITEAANQTLSNVTVYPNPAKDNINLNFTNVNADNASYEMVNVLGQTVRTQAIPVVKGETLYNVSLTGIESGVYFIKLNVGAKTSVTKITVQ
jgi:hypothetical protein